MIFRKDTLTVFTDDLNNVDYTRCITFVYEEESTGMIPFMNLLSKCQPGGSVLVQVYWKATHAELCLLLGSHDAISHKTGVVRTVMVLTERRRRTTHFDRLWLYTVVIHGGSVTRWNMIRCVQETRPERLWERLHRTVEAGSHYLCRRVVKRLLEESSLSTW